MLMRPPTLSTMQNAPNPSIRMICFDLGRVLVRICDGWQHAAELAGLKLGLPPRGQLFKGDLHDAVCAMETGAIDTDEFCRLTAAALGAQPREVRSILDVYLIEPYEGVGELVEEINTAGYVTACLSNTNTEHWQQMFDPSDRCGLPMDRMRHHFASHLVRLRKPDAAIYQHVEQATGFAADQIVFFDDMAENVAAAVERGWRAHQILHESSNPVEQMRRHLAAHGVLRSDG